MPKSYYYFFSIGGAASKCDIPLHVDSLISYPHGVGSLVEKLEIISCVKSLRQYDRYDVNIYAGLVSDPLVDHVFI